MNEFQKKFEKVLKFALIRPRSEKEIKDYFNRKKIDKKIQIDIFSQLKNFDLINDKKFAKWWVETRNELSPKSKRALVNELRIKGIKSETIDNVINKSELDEEKNAINLLQKRKMHWENIDQKKRTQKMTLYLIRKGFSFSIAKSAIEYFDKNR